MQNPKNLKVLVGMSGGVDSSVSALLLKQQGYQVEGLFMKNWEEDDTETYCAAAQDAADAKAVCDIIGIPFHTINFAAEYWDHVFENFLTEYQAGRTPNPDILCNKMIKFKAFLDYAAQLGADYIATGHYARIGEHNKQYSLLKGSDANKDQSYFLYTLNQAQLAKSLFPIGHLTKPEVRKLAEQHNLPTFAKKDSTGICFIGERKFKDFLSRYLPAQPGNIETETGKIIGKHDGLMYYTIGQRKGIGIGGRKDSDIQPWYVTGKDLQRNVLIIGQGEDNPALFRQTLTFNQSHWVAGHPPALPYHCMAKTRYRQPDQACEIQCIDAKQALFQAVFETPQRAITPGQSIVLYENEQCLGGGVIL